jgi:hypothetical protein
MQKNEEKKRNRERERAGRVIMYNKEENQGHGRLTLSWFFLVQKYYVRILRNLDIMCTDDDFNARLK